MVWLCVGANVNNTTTWKGALFQHYFYLPRGQISSARMSTSMEAASMLALILALDICPLGN
jgi:hypothetical protein